jgi:hypothetical protein
VIGAFSRELLNEPWEALIFLHAENDLSEQEIIKNVSC